MSTSNDTAIDLGPLEPILADPEVSEILIDGPNRIQIVRGGQLQDVDARFDDNEQLTQIVRAIITPLGRRFDESNPIVDARLADGTRMTAVGHPICLLGTAVVLRKFRKDIMTNEKLIEYGSWSPAILEFLRACVSGRLNILVSGGTGSGKTTLINVIGRMIPPEERIITVEDASEIQLDHPRVLPLESRPPNLEGKGAITVPDLVRQALRMRPERLIVGELRGAEIWPLLQAISTGHDGSMATLHASSPRDALTQLEIMATAAEPSIPLLNVREQLASALDLIVQINRLADGRRRVTAITEVVGLERETIALRDIFVFAAGQRDERGAVQGHFSATGAVPTFLPRLRQHGIELSMELFRPVD